MKKKRNKVVYHEKIFKNKKSVQLFNSDRPILNEKLFCPKCSSQDNDLHVEMINTGDPSLFVAEYFLCNDCNTIFFLHNGKIRIFQKLQKNS